ncbi:MAG: efflux RND transporter permease subunit [Bacteroidetes bacterium]|nr:efflux RND transporter permease subunit [Bacteroidota bacterium]
MKLITSALRHPVTIIVSVLAIVFFSYLAIRNSKIDIFPKLGLPTVYVAQPYGGLSPEQMEGFVSSYYEYHFLYINGVKYVDSKSIQGACVLKLEFNEGTDMSQAMAEVVGYVNRARAFMPPGTVPPFITRFDAGSVPVGQLVFSSETRTLGEISDLALFRVRPMFATLPGVSAPPPFGGNQKTVLITVDPDKIRSYNLSPDDVVQALVKTNIISPAGNMRIGDTTFITPQNSVIENINEFNNVPIKLGAGPAVYIKDIATVSMGSDVTTSYALVNGKRSVYIPVTKRADASTLDVVRNVKKALPDMQAAIPSDIKVSYEFDQSGYVINSLKSVLFEGGLGALLTGLVVLLFLSDLRSAAIMVMTIPLALLSSVTVLFVTGQTLNIMTLGGLALAVGILVDEATVTIENIHRHQEMKKPKARAIVDACKEIASPKLLILLSILAVFVPSIFMNGVPKAMFLPLSFAVGFAMIASFLLSQTFVPVVANWMLKEHLKNNEEHKETLFKRWQKKYESTGKKLEKRFGVMSILFLIVSIALCSILFISIGTELFPKTDSGQTQVRLRLSVGTRLERTEDATKKLLELSANIAGNNNIEISSAFIGTQPSSFPINNIHLWTSGPQESVTKIKLKKGIISISKFQEELREAVKKNIPGATISFEPGDIVEQVLNLGSTNPVEIIVVNKNLEQGKQVADALMKKLSEINSLRDLQIATPLKYPTLKINIDRLKAGQLNITADQIAKSTVAATTSSRFTAPSYWLDKTTGTAYQVQVQYPEYKMNNTGKLESVPVSSGNNSTHYLNEVANWNETTTPGEYDRLNQQRYITITANVYKQDVGTVFKKIQSNIDEVFKSSNGSKITMRGQSQLLQQTISGLQFGLLIAIVVIFLMMAVFFQSFRIAVTTLSVIPAVIAGALLLLLLTGKTLNIQSYMGTIMAIGVAVSNAVLFLSNAEFLRRNDNTDAIYLRAASSRMRPILMTSIAMIAGMIPMALGLTEGGDQTAPLGVAVIGGLIFSAISILFFLPHVYNWGVGRKKFRSASLDPDDANSIYYDKKTTEIV